MSSIDFLNTDFARESRFPIDFHVTPAGDAWDRLARQYNYWLNRDQSNIVEYQQIPKIIHQIWLGGALPRRYKQWCESWITLNSRYTYKLWTDRDVCFRSKDLYNIFLKTTNIGAKSDILRYEILDRYGGFYCDTDLECVKDFDGLFLNTSFAACSLFSMEPHFGNGFIACSPGHPIIRSIIKSIKTPITTRDVIEIIDTIGPGLLTKKCLEYIDSSFDQSCALLPSNYVYPWPNYLRSDNLSPKKYLTATSIGIHYWEMSWTEKGLSRLFRRYIRNPIRKLAKILVSCVGLGR